MMNRTSLAAAGAVAAAGLLALIATTGQAGDSAKGPPDGPPFMKPPAFADIDANHDGTISQAEFEAFHAAHKPPEGGPPHDGPPPGDHRGHRGPFGFKSLDANGDGKVTLEEFEAPLKDRFTRLDANHDGVLDASELEKGRPEGEGPPPAK